jgi:hypothetical protein
MKAMSNIKVSNKFSDNVATPKMFGNCSIKNYKDMYVHREGQGQPRAVEPVMMMMYIHRD